MTGGVAPGHEVAEATLMARALARYDAELAIWEEARSRTTAENAAFSAPLLRRHGVSAIALVTHTSHMARAVAEFRGQGFEVIPAPVVRLAREFRWLDLLPSAGALSRSAAALHEYAGRAVYALVG